MPLPRSIGNVGPSTPSLQPAHVERRVNFDLGKPLLAAAQVQAQFETADASARLIEAQAEAQRRLDELRRTAPDKFVTEAPRIIDETINKAIEPYSSEVARSLQPNITRVRVGLQQYAYKATVEDTSVRFGTRFQAALEAEKAAVAEGFKSASEARAAIDAVIDKAPLLPADKEQLRQRSYAAVERLEARRRFTDIATSEVSKTGIPPVSRAFLDVIASVESPGYDIIYGGKRIKDLSWHPGIAQRTPDGRITTAAGRYQFTKPTWEELAKRYGIEDFSPQNQDFAAWKLAEERYRRKTGRELLADLLSGDPGRLAEVHKALKSTWAGLGRLSPEEFTQRFLTNLRKTLPAEVTYGDFKALPVEERLSIWFDAQRRGAALGQAAVATAEAERRSAIEDLRSRIASGEATLDDIRNAPVTLKPAERLELEALYAKTNAEGLAYAEAQQRLASGNGLLDADKTVVEAWANRSILPKIEAGDFASVVQEVHQARVVPKVAVQALATAVEQRGPAAALPALQALSAMRGLQGWSDSLLPENVQQMLGLYDVLSKYEEPGQIVQRLEALRDPAMASTFANLRQQGEAAMRKRLSEGRLRPSEIKSALLGSISGFTTDVPDDPLTQQRLVAEYAQLYPEAFAYTADPSRAHELTVEWMRQRWGVSEVGGEKRLTILPPERIYPLVNGSHDWIEKQAREELGIPDSMTFVLIPNAQTEAEINAWRAGALDHLPSYMVGVRRPDGVIDILRDEQGRVKMFYGDPSGPQRQTEHKRLLKRFSRTVRVGLPGLDSAEQERVATVFAELAQGDPKRGEELLALAPKLEQGAVGAEALLQLLDRWQVNKRAPQIARAREILLDLAGGLYESPVPPARPETEVSPVPPPRPEVQ